MKLMVMLASLVCTGAKKPTQSEFDQLAAALNITQPVCHDSSVLVYTRLTCISFPMTLPIPLEVYVQ
jgi:hypothetical protein